MPKRESETPVKKLVIVPSSTRMAKEPKEPIPAIQRYDGIFARSIRKYASNFKSIDILFLSPVYGFISPEKKIPYHEPISGNWHKVEFNQNHIKNFQKTNLETLEKILSAKKYDEIYINVGKTMLQLIEGFERIVPESTKITFSVGNGVGPKVTHMRNWVESQKR